MARFLVLGAGFVAEPLVEYLYRCKDNHITVVGYTLLEAQNLAKKFAGVDALQTDVSDKAALLKLIEGFDIVVSLVPASFHLLIAQVCIQLKVNMVTASYQTKAMSALARQAEEAGICIMNEIGLDPGIDHLSAMQTIDKVQSQGDEVESFVSWCGGIPAPDSNDNPFSYKFSWEPRGAIMALHNDAVYQINRQEIKVAGKNLMQWSQAIEIADLELECYPNRESVSYKDIYGISTVKDILRGTLRYRGFCEIFQHLKDLGLMQTEPSKIPENINWKDYILGLNNAKSLDEIQSKMSQKVCDAINWLGCFSDTLIVAEKACSIDALCDLLLQKLSYKDNEKDMIVLQHKFVVKKPDGSRYFISSILKYIGNPASYGAMAKTVGYPAAIASQLIADNKIKTKGILLPISKEIYQPILDLLEQEGIAFTDELLTDKETSPEKFLAELTF